MQIDDIELTNNVILAPMAGVTDLPYRNICRELGAGAAVGEMLSANKKLWNTNKSQFRQVQKSEKGIRWIQILGNDPSQMASAAQSCEALGAQIIDINMGCPAKKVCKKAAGSALMQDEKLVEKILIAVVDSVNIPVTLKMRTGWNQENKNAVTIAKIAENSGIKAISIHGRTRQCKYDVPAEFETVTQVKKSIALPTIVNGDINSAKKAKTILDHTGADGIMLGRAALGNPWLLKEVSHYINQNKVLAPPTLVDIYHVIYKHINSLHNFYGDYLGLRMARKHLTWYEEKFQALSMKRDFNRIETASGQIEFINHYFDSLFNDDATIDISKGKYTKEIAA